MHSQVEAGGLFPVLLLGDGAGYGGAAEPSSPTPQASLYLGVLHPGPGPD